MELKIHGRDLNVYYWMQQLFGGERRRGEGLRNEERYTRERENVID